MKTFQELELIAPLQKALDAENYKHPTPIQSQAIPAALQGRDVLGCAQTGTGKTAAFALPILDWLGEINRKAIPNHPAALVLAPTRELAIQIGESFETYGRNLRIKVALVYGGVSQVSQVRNLKRGSHIVVATPGRLLDLMDQNHLDLKYLKRFVLDEADQMLNMGFLPDLQKIIKCLPARRQSMFFSATLPPKILDLSRRLLKNPLHVDVTPKTTSVKKIDQSVSFVEKRAKLSLLKKIIDGVDVQRALVFTRTKRGANLVAKKLDQVGISSAAIHGNKSQSARVSALEAFRRNDIKVLVATDIAARGIDIDGITHVLNYDMPVEPESYVHRIGRTGRAGAAGIAISFCTAAERPDLRAIERLIGKSIPVESQGAGTQSRDQEPDQEREQPRPNRNSRPRRSARKPQRRQQPESQQRESQPVTQRAEPRQKRQNQMANRQTATKQTAKPTENRTRKPASAPKTKESGSRSAAPRGLYFLTADDFASGDSPKTDEKPKKNRRRRRRKALASASS